MKRLEQRSEPSFRRVEIIFAGLSQGKTIPEIDARLHRFEGGYLRQRRGQESEQRVAQVLLGVSYVGQVRLTRPREELDNKGIDLVVSLLAETIDCPFETVLVQVKSSEKWADGFKKDTHSARHPKLSPEEILKKRRLIVLNGQAPPKSIKDSFQTQLYEIIVYHTTRRSPRKRLPVSAKA